MVRDSALGDKADSGWLGAEQRWTVSHLGTSCELIGMGLGFAWLPVTRIAAELRGGTLEELPLISGGRRSSHLYLTYADRDGSGPATCLLADRIRAHSPH